MGVHVGIALALAPTSIGPRCAKPSRVIVWGKPSRETAKELRWGTHGSRCLDRQRGVWFDHEHNCGGGAFDLVPGTSSRERMEWLRQHHLIGCRRG